MADDRQVIIVCALVHRLRDGKSQAFVARRAATKPFLPSVFELPGGHVDEGEASVVALQREFQEEFSASIRVGDPFATFSYRDVSGANSTEIVYFATFNDLAAEIKLLPAEHSEYRWVGLDDIDSIAKPTKKIDDDEFIALRHGLEILSGSHPNFG
jgi:8-oxo-dGTP diphosphatase